RNGKVIFPRWLRAQKPGSKRASFFCVHLSTEHVSEQTKPIVRDPCLKLPVGRAATSHRARRLSRQSTDRSRAPRLAPFVLASSPTWRDASGAHRNHSQVKSAKSGNRIAPDHSM